jgi:ribosomal protein S27AE
MLEIVREPGVISGHPTVPLLDGPSGNLVQMITVCAHCGEARTILFLRKDRWLCTQCRMEGVAPPNLYPVK